MIKPILRKELYDRIHIHQSTSDYSEFFNKFIPRSHMPSDYGGNLSSISQLNEENRKYLYEMRGYFLSEMDQMNLKFEDRVIEPSADEDDEFFDAE